MVEAPSSDPRTSAELPATEDTMAKTAKPTRETSLPLIISLVFFILLSIGLGVFVYVLNSDQAAKDDTVKKANDDVKALRTTVDEEKQIARIHRIVMGLEEGSGDTADLKTVLGDVKEGSRPHQELKKIMDAMKRKAPELAKAEADRFNTALEAYLSAKGKDAKFESGDFMKEGDFAFWSAEFDPATKALKAPTGNLLDTTVRARLVRDVAARQSAADFAAYQSNLKLMADAAREYTKASDVFAKASIKMPKDLGEAIKALSDKTDKRNKSYDADNANYAKQVDDLNGNIAALTLTRNNLEKEINQLKGSLIDARQKAANKVDPFQFDEPQGKILRRLPDKMVEIDLGSNDRVQPGLTFTVLPYDYPQKGRQSRMQLVRVTDGRGGFKSVEQFVPKATIEVVAVLGPTSSSARITQHDDDIRDPVLTTDLIYNSVWRRGQSDRIALIGIFDVNGDGTDDIDAVRRDLEKMGIPVDAWFDIRTGKWNGKITERTRFVVEGYLPGLPEQDANRDAKTKLIGQISDAIKKDVQERNIQIVNFRDFFPRMGYKMRTDVSEDRIQQSLSRYIGVGTSAEKPPVKDGN